MGSRIRGHLQSGTTTPATVGCLVSVLADPRRGLQAEHQGLESLALRENRPFTACHSGTRAPPGTELRPGWNLCSRPYSGGSPLVCREPKGFGQSNKGPGHRESWRHRCSSAAPRHLRIAEDQETCLWPLGTHLLAYGTRSRGSSMTGTAHRVDIKPPHHFLGSQEEQAEEHQHRTLMLPATLPEL